MWWAMAIAAAIQVVQGVMSNVQQTAAGDAARDAGKYQNLLAQREADSLEQEAGQERARSQQEAILRRRRGNITHGRGEALEAASGALDEGGYNEARLLEDIDQSVASALYTGESAGRGLEDRAQLTRTQGEFAQYRGKVQQKALKHEGLMSLASGILGAGGEVASYYNQQPDPSGGGGGGYNELTVGGYGGSVEYGPGSPLYRNYGAYGRGTYGYPGSR